MPLSEMSDVQREAIFEECMKDIDNLNRWLFFPVYFLEAWKALHTILFLTMT